MDPLPVTVVIPTIGRPALLRACLESVQRCSPRPAEVVVVDQSTDEVTAAVCRDFADIGTRRVACGGTSIGAAMNHGLREARHRAVLITNDDITVAVDWVASAADKLHAAPDALHSGRVLPVGDGRSVPTWIADEDRRVHASRRAMGVLYPCNMACDREAVLGIGGFDPRIRPAAEDNDLCYRWLCAGRAVHYDPDMLAWHHGWRSPEALRAQYISYARGDGLFWTKHLLHGDPFVLRFLAKDLILALRTSLRALWRRPTYPVYGLGVLLRGLPLGVVDGLRLYRPWTRSIDHGPTSC
jgi:GT2 family glycosyltransferase